MEKPPSVRAPDETKEDKQKIEYRWTIGPSADEPNGTDYVVVSIDYMKGRCYYASVNRKTFTPIGMNCFPADFVTLAKSERVERFSPRSLKEFALTTLFNLAALFADRSYVEYDSQREHLDEWLPFLLSPASAPPLPSSPR